MIAGTDSLINSIVALSEGLHIVVLVEHKRGVRLNEVQDVM